MTVGVLAELTDFIPSVLNELKPFKNGHFLSFVDVVIIGTTADIT